jgi:hypothetical protein
MQLRAKGKHAMATQVHKTLPGAQVAAEIARQAADAAQQYADQAAPCGGERHAATGAAIDPFVFRFSIFVLRCSSAITWSGR